MHLVGFYYKSRKIFFKSYFSNRVECSRSIKLETRFVVSPYSLGGGGGTFSEVVWCGKHSEVDKSQADSLLSIYTSHSHLLYRQVMSGKVVDNPTAFSSVLNVHCQGYGQPAGPLICY